MNETVKKTKETDAVAGKNQVPLLCSFLVSPPLKIKRIIFSLPVLYVCLAFFQFQKFLQISKNQDQNVFWDIPSTFDLWILPPHPQLADFAGFGFYTSEASKSYQELMVLTQPKCSKMVTNIAKISHFGKNQILKIVKPKFFATLSVRVSRKRA